ncbi:hypothetical protein [Rummeliibacillus pycnus]|uniref:hypothetical protein n=1 Tax=Rummeliibacillus pycnus TaxID=101070 RepID=UPI0037C8D41E
MKSNISLLVKILLGCALLLFNVPNVKAEEVQSFEVDKFEAENVAKKFIEYKMEVFKLQDKNYELKLLSELYGLDDKMNSYYFQIYTKDALVGYVMIAADYRFDPIFEYGIFENNYDYYYGKELANKTQKAYYLGGQGVKISDSASSVEKEIYNKIQNIANSTSKNNGSLSNISIGIQHEKDTNPLWNDIHDSSKVGVQSVPPVTLNVTRVWQRQSGVTHPDSSCGPAAGAMIANYYKDIKGYKVRGKGSYSNSNANLINHLYFEMNSYALGTNSYSLANGFQVHLNHDMTGWKYTRTTDPGYSNVTAPIRDGHPVATVWLALGDEDYHWRVINGIDTDGGQYLSYKDSDGGSDNTGAHWVSWSTMVGKVHTVSFSR